MKIFLGLGLLVAPLCWATASRKSWPVADTAAGMVGTTAGITAAIEGTRDTIVMSIIVMPSHNAYHHSHWANRNRPFSRHWYEHHHGAWGGGWGWGNPWNVANWGTTSSAWA